MRLVRLLPFCLLLAAGSAVPRLAHADRKVAPSPSQRVVKTPMAEVRFGVRLNRSVSLQHRTRDGKVVQIQAPGEVSGLIVTSAGEFVDPKRQEITVQVAQPGRIQQAEQLLDVLKAELGTRQGYLAATDVQAAEQLYATMARKEQLIDAVAKLIPSTALNGTERGRALAALQQLRSRVRWEVEHRPTIGQGVAQDYHPYWSPFDKGLTLLRDVAHVEVRHAVQSALKYILRRKTALAGQEVREWDLERSLGLRVAADTDAEESVSLKKGTENDYLPTYVTLTIKASGLPSDLAAHAGQPVYRAGADYYLDGTGTRLPASVEQHLVERPIEYAAMTLRKPRAGEVLRPDFKFDWTGSGGINSTPVDLSWWGHCHLEAPLAALGIEAKTKVTYYNAVSKKEATFDQNHANDLLFALFDAEQMMDPQSGRSARLDQHKFVGNRNDTFDDFGDQLRIHTDRGTMPFDARLKQVFGPGNGQAPIDQTFLFQKNIPGGPNHLSPNPEFLRAEQGDVHVIKGDRKVVAEIKFPEWDSNGFPRERREWVTIDPQAPGRVFVGASIEQKNGGEVLTKYYLNLRDKRVESLSWQGVRQGGVFQRKLLNAVDPGAAPAGEEFAGIRGMPRFDVAASGVRGFDLSREVVKEGAEDIGEFVEDSIRHRKGAVVETSVAGPVWNYPMTNAKVSDVTRTPRPGFLEDAFRGGERVHMSANGSAAVIARTRDANGKVKEAEFESPFLDFAWRPERWHALPFSESGLVNYDALKRGYLIGKDAQGNHRFTDSFYGMATDVLYLSMVDGSKGHLFGIRKADGTLEYFDTQAEYERAKGQLPR